MLRLLCGCQQLIHIRAKMFLWICTCWQGYVVRYATAKGSSEMLSGDLLAFSHFTQIDQLNKRQSKSESDVKWKSRWKTAGRQIKQMKKFPFLYFPYGVGPFASFIFSCQTACVFINKALFMFSILFSYSQININKDRGAYISRRQFDGGTLFSAARHMWHPLLIGSGPINIRLSPPRIRSLRWRE